MKKSLKNILLVVLIVITTIITQNNMHQLKDPLDKVSKNLIKKVVKESLPDLVFDVLWDNLFYWNGLFESFDGWVVGDSGSGGTVVGGTGVTLETGATTNDETEIIKKPDFQNILTFDARSRFKTAFRFSTGSDADSEFNVSIGQGGVISTFNHYGFFVDGGVLYGSVADGATQSTIALMSITDEDRYLVEARLLPNNRVVFFVSDADGFKLIERGSLVTNLPNGKINFSTNNFWVHYNLTTKEEAAKVIQFDFIEYLQIRIRF